MSFKLGFNADIPNIEPKVQAIVPPKETKPRKSLVRVYFESLDRAYTYYNDRFDLKLGDRVYVEGKLEGNQGRVVEINCNFKIDLADYKRVIAVIDTDIKGQFYIAGSHILTFDPNALPIEKASLWFMPPIAEDAEIVSGYDDTSFRLDELSGMNVGGDETKRGFDYYFENKVRYICLDKTKGYAVVQGSKVYEVEFEYQNGEVSKLTCSCFSCLNCRHEFAAMLQLNDTLEQIRKLNAAEFERSGYFAAADKEILVKYGIMARNSGGIKFE